MMCDTENSAKSVLPTLMVKGNFFNFSEFFLLLLHVCMCVYMHKYRHAIIQKSENVAVFANLIIGYLSQNECFFVQLSVQ